MIFCPETASAHPGTEAVSRRTAYLSSRPCRTKTDSDSLFPLTGKSDRCRYRSPRVCLMVSLKEKGK